MAYEDKSLTCVECSQSFTFSADDQTYHAEKGYTNEPKRCPSCRQARRGGQSGGGGYSDCHATPGYGAKPYGGTVNQSPFCTTSADMWCHHRMTGRTGHGSQDSGS